MKTSMEALKEFCLFMRGKHELNEQIHWSYEVDFPRWFERELLKPMRENSPYQPHAIVRSVIGDFNKRSEGLKVDVGDVDEMVGRMRESVGKVI